MTPLLPLFLVMLYVLPRSETVVAAILGAVLALYAVVFLLFGGLYVKMKKRFGQ